MHQHGRYQDIKEVVLEEVKEMEERSLLVIQGGNNLEATSTEETMKEIIQAVTKDECGCGGNPVASTRSMV